ncbi:MAG: hypothetical protein WA126_15885 [Thermodesulfovibrionales bacterium]
MKGTLVIETILKEVVIQDGNTRRIIKNVLVRKVSSKGKETVESITLPKDNSIIKLWANRGMERIANKAGSR